jgi:hypothetical protein
MIDNASLQSDGSVEVQVTDNAVEDPPSGGGTVVNVYKLTFKVQQEQGKWKVTPHELQRKPIQGVCKSS